MNVEFLIPMVLGGLPGHAFSYGFRALAGLPLLRVLAASTGHFRPGGADFQW